jgi:NhaA family Na+:H+ antiporter
MNVARPTLRLFGAVVRPLQSFLRTEASSGVLLLAGAVAALLWANIDEASYRGVFAHSFDVGAGAAIGHFTFRELVNDGLMAIFFFVVGMEIKRELVVGELDSMGKASLPAVAALGGMLLPAAIFLAFNRGRAGSNGWGIPMATDIAFCVGILALLKDRVPHALVVFVTALAIFDDIGGILVIAFFYGHGVALPWLLAAGVVFVALFFMNRIHVANGLAYGLGGACLWYALHHAGIHATIAGVIVGLLIPARPRRDSLEELEPPVERFVRLLHPLVAFGIVPLFALANSGVVFRSVGISTLTEPTVLGAAAGLFIGKQAGIFGVTLVAVKLRLAPMPGGVSRMKLFGVSVVSGIGFTVALFIAALAYADAPELLEHAKLGILLGSLLAGVVGFTVLRLTPGRTSTPEVTSE